MSIEDDLLSPISTSHTLHDLTLYTTPHAYYILGGNRASAKYKILCIDRVDTTFVLTKQYVTPNYELSLYEDNDTYTVESGRAQIEHLIAHHTTAPPPDTTRATSPPPPSDSSSGAGASGAGGGRGVKGRKISALLGFIRLPKLYMIIVSKKQRIGTICSSSIYSCAAVELLPVYHDSRHGKDINQHIHSHTPQYKQYVAEYQVDQRYKQLLLSSIDFRVNYYFAYNYDITHTMQYNAQRTQQAATSAGSMGDRYEAQTTMPQHARQPSLMPDKSSAIYNTQFVWNCNLVNEFISLLPHGSYWLVPLVHGYFAQVNTTVNGSNVTLTLLARRSQYYAGTRYIKRGIDEYGHVANEVESELILSHKPNAAQPPQYSSVVFLRGSIPLQWTQDNAFSAKPSIIVSTFDNNFMTTKQHFDDVFARYGSPVAVLSLIKQTEKVPQESKLGYAFNHAINKLNDQYKAGADGDQIQYYTYDFLNNRAAKRNVLYDLKLIVTPVCQQINVFHYDAGIQSLQHGVLRVNCVDCLDRTNVAIFCAAKCCLRQQLRLMRLIDSSTDSDDLDTELLNALQLMFTAHGDCIATQYAGSGAMHKHEIYGSDNAVVKNAAGKGSEFNRDKMMGVAQNAFTAAKRFYSNNITDYDKQSAYNILLGNFVPAYDSTHIWDIDPHTHMPANHHNTFTVPYRQLNLFGGVGDDEAGYTVDNAALSDDEVPVPAAATSAPKVTITSKLLQAAQSVDTQKLSMFGRQLASRFNKAIAGKPAAATKAQPSMTLEDMMTHVDTPANADDNGDESSTTSEPNSAASSISSHANGLRHSVSQPQKMSSSQQITDPFAALASRNTPTTTVAEPHSHSQLDEFDDFVSNTRVTPSKKSTSSDVDLLTSDSPHHTASVQESSVDDLFAQLRSG